MNENFEKNWRERMGGGEGRYRKQRRKKESKNCQRQEFIRIFDFIHRKRGKKIEIKFEKKTPDCVQEQNRKREGGRERERTRRNEKTKKPFVFCKMSIA